MVHSTDLSPKIANVFIHFRGYFQTAEQRFIIEPLSEDTDGDHAVMKYEDVTGSPYVCGVTNKTRHPIPEGSSPGKSKARMSVSEISYHLEMFCSSV